MTRPRTAVAAAVAGLVVPTVLYLIISQGSGQEHAWGIVISTDTAFLVGALIVLADASLIEPVAVASNLWAWTEPGLFAVPPIGILGWAIMFPRPSQLRDWYERQGAGSALPEMNVGGPA